MRELKKIKINKTYYDIDKIEKETKNGYEYTNYHISLKNTKKVLVYNKTRKDYTLWGVKPRLTMTTPYLVAL